MDLTCINCLRWVYMDWEVKERLLQLLVRDGYSYEYALRMARALTKYPTTPIEYESYMLYMNYRDNGEI